MTVKELTEICYEPFFYIEESIVIDVVRTVGIFDRRDVLSGNIPQWLAGAQVERIKIIDENTIGIRV